MDLHQIERMVEMAVERGEFDQELLEAVRASSLSSVNPIRAEILWRIYRRRIRRTPVGSELRALTVRLVEFLHPRADETLVMIWLESGERHGPVLLADEDANELYWMKMLDRPKFKDRKSGVRRGDAGQR